MSGDEGTEAREACCGWLLVSLCCRSRSERGAVGPAFSLSLSLSLCFLSLSSSAGHRLSRLSLSLSCTASSALFAQTTCDSAEAAAARDAHVRLCVVAACSDSGLPGRTLHAGRHCARRLVPPTPCGAESLAACCMLLAACCAPSLQGPEKRRGGTFFSGFLILFLIFFTSSFFAVRIWCPLAWGTYGPLAGQPGCPVLLLGSLFFSLFVFCAASETRLAQTQLFPHDTCCFTWQQDNTTVIRGHLHFSSFMSFPLSPKASLMFAFEFDNSTAQFLSPTLHSASKPSSSGGSGCFAAFATAAQGKAMDGYVSFGPPPDSPPPTQARSGFSRWFTFGQAADDSSKTAQEQSQQPHQQQQQQQPQQQPGSHQQQPQPQHQLASQQQLRLTQPRQQLLPQQLQKQLPSGIQPQRRDDSGLARTEAVTGNNRPQIVVPAAAAASSSAVRGVSHPVAASSSGPKSAGAGRGVTLEATGGISQPVASAAPPTTATTATANVPATTTASSPPQGGASSSAPGSSTRSYNELARSYGQLVCEFL